MKILGVIGLILAFMIASPLIALIGIYSLFKLWRPTPSYFPPEHPDSAKVWAEKMERARRAQAREEDD